MDLRTEGQILAGQVPSVGPIVLGGRDYSVREPSLMQTSAIMALQGEYHDLQKQADGLPQSEQLRRINEIMFSMVREFSAEIREDWDRIMQEATADELLSAVEVVSRVVSAPFVRRALAASAPPNRETRRKTKAKKR